MAQRTEKKKKEVKNDPLSSKPQKPGFFSRMLRGKKFDAKAIVKAEGRGEIGFHLGGDVGAVNDLIIATLHNLQYDGFSAVRCRSEVMGMVEAEGIAVAIAAYVRIGNNPSRAVGKVIQRMDEVVNLSNQIKPHTLARLGIAFMPMTYYCRHMAKDTLQRQFEVKADPVICDPSFQGWIGAEIKDFLEAFDRALNPPGQEQANRRPVSYWMNLATEGLKQDPGMRELMNLVRVNPNLGLLWFNHLYSGGITKLAGTEWVNPAPLEEQEEVEELAHA